MECCRALQGGDEGYFATTQIGLGESEIARQGGGIFEVIWAYLIWTMIKLKTWDLGSVLKNLFHLIKQTTGTGAKRPNHYTFQSGSFHCIQVWLCTFRDYPKWNRVKLGAKRYDCSDDRCTLGGLADIHYSRPDKDRQSSAFK